MMNDEMQKAIDERDAKWVGAIQGAIGNMGRSGDREYFTFCLFLIFEQAEKDGIYTLSDNGKKQIERLRPIINRKKDILCGNRTEVEEATRLWHEWMNAALAARNELAKIKAED